MIKFHKYHEPTSFPKAVGEMRPGDTFIRQGEHYIRSDETVEDSVATGVESYCEFYGEVCNPDFVLATRLSDGSVIRFPPGERYPVTELLVPWKLVPVPPVGELPDLL